MIDKNAPAAGSAAKTFDAGIEWYFARVGSLTLNGFYKTIDNFFYQSLITRNITSNGVTLPVTAEAPAAAPAAACGG